MLPAWFYALKAAPDWDKRCNEKYPAIVNGYNAAEGQLGG